MEERMNPAKPTKEDLLKRTFRGGLVFLFDYPLRDPDNYHAGSRLPTDETLERIETALFDLPGVFEVTYHLTVMSITVNDDEDDARHLSDQQFCERIATLFHRFWKE